MSLSTPVVFLIFNRPDLTRRVFEVISKAKPRQLFVVADGPRSSEDVEKCAQTRAVIDRIDWECDMHKNFSDKNLGCGRRISSGIDWVFSQVDEAIILEDDTLPVDSFFTYCQLLLERYRDDARVMTINGNNFQSGQSRSEYSYHFSKYNACWGWATWRRAWMHYDYEMKTWPVFKRSGMLEGICEDPCEQQFWSELFDSMHANPAVIDTWDHQWKYACWSQNGLAIEPSVNLVSNLGLARSDATHTTGNNPMLEQISKTREIMEIKHAPLVARNRAADQYIFNYIIGGLRMKRNHTLSGRLYNRIAGIYDKIRMVLRG